MFFFFFFSYERDSSRRRHCRAEEARNARGMLGAIAAWPTATYVRFVSGFRDKEFVEPWAGARSIGDAVTERAA